MKLMRWFAVVVLAGSVAGCATAVTYEARFGADQWRMGIAERGIDSPDLVYPFATSPEMEAWAREVAGRYVGMGPVTRLKLLQQSMFDRDAFTFAYDETRTLTAAEAFEQRRGNCLAFTSLFVAASRSLGLRTFLVSVRRPPEYTRDEDLVVVNRHVVAGFIEGGHLHLFDFYVLSRVPYFQHEVVDDIMATAMYHNNLGGAAIRHDEPELALRHLELAVRLAPDLEQGWINLGVARSRSGDLDGALDAYQRALVIQPGHPSALTNMAYVYQQMGRDEEARNALVAAASSQSTPFSLVALADLEMARGDLHRAERYLRRARRIDREEPAVYEGFARLADYRSDSQNAVRFRRRAEVLRAASSTGSSPIPPRLESSSSS